MGFDNSGRTNKLGLNINYLSGATIATTRTGKAVSLREQSLTDVRDRPTAYLSKEAALLAARAESMGGQSAVAVVNLDGDYYTLSLESAHKPFHLGDDALRFELITGQGEHVETIVDGNREVSRYWGNTRLGDVLLHGQAALEGQIEYSAVGQAIAPALKALTAPGDWVVNSVLTPIAGAFFRTSKQRY